MERIAVIFFNADNVPLEKFVFKLALDQYYGTEVEESDLESSLRLFLNKLSVSESLTKELPQGKCEYSLAFDSLFFLTLFYLLFLLISLSLSLSLFIH